ncbi:MAG TPA: hypothetical protein VK771_08945 [Acidimicrobiia bacterium]|nr:hypothetical protein [Acidimicrobiia bacterium]
MGSGALASTDAVGAAVSVPNPGRLAAGNGQSCAVLAAGTVKCWGLNRDGELGNGTTTSASRPVAVTGLGGVRAVTAGDYHSCALLDNGTVLCWGYNFHGELGVNHNGPALCSRRPGTAGQACSTTPVAVPGLSGVSALAAGAYHTCALMTTGTVKCWGYNAEGQLGNPSVKTSSTPVDVVGLNGVRAIAAGGVSSCALLKIGSVKCWGHGYNQTPTAVAGLSGVDAISAGYYFACAVLASDTVKCWGSNDFGQLGDGTFTRSPRPVTVTGLTGITAIGAGEDHACAVTSAGSVACWGFDQWGQLGVRPNVTPTTNCGDGSPCHPIAVPVNRLAGVGAITGGFKHTCAVLKTGSVWCWGYNGDGELGNRQRNSSYTPVFVSGV